MTTSIFRFLALIAAVGLWSCENPSKTQELTSAPTGLYSIRLFDLEETRDFYSWTSDRIPMVSAHRGGPYPGFPENAIETFEHVLKSTPSIIEFDVAMTRDSVLVLMHDDELDRTTNGTGKVNEVDFAYVQSLFLEDNEGNLTEFKVPRRGFDLDQRQSPPDRGYQEISSI